MKKFPKTKRDNITDGIEDFKISDPYRWLEDGKNTKVKDWIKSQNEYTEKDLKDQDYKIFFEELNKDFDFTGFSLPVGFRGLYFHNERKPGQDQWVVYYRKGLRSEPIVLVDTNGMNEKNTVSLDYWNPSWTGKYLSYGLSEGGTEMATLHVMEVESRKDRIIDTIPNCRHASIRWLPDDSGFFYTRNPKPGTVPKNEEHLHPKIYFHKLGINPEEDELIFGADLSKDVMVRMSSFSDNGRYLAINVSLNWHENEVYIYDCETKETTPLITKIPARFNLFFLKDRAIVRTNYLANNSRVLWSPLDKIFKPIEEWADLIPEKEYSLESIHVTSDRLIAEYSVNVSSKVLMFDYNGNQVGELPLPEYCSLSGISSDREEEEFFYGVDSLTFPKIEYRFDPETKKFEEFRRMESPIDPDDYVVKQEWAKSKDGTKIPMFVVHKKDIKEGPNPLVLYGYGGFGNSLTPFFSRPWIPWLKRGGIFVQANIRGGGEFGHSWHTQGIKEHKQNSFDDFIASAELLIEKGYTDKEHLGIRGGSNGGLLVTAVEVQRPDLFKAVCAEVPLTDMVRFPLFSIASRWIHEYGDPSVKEDLGRILKWSPYHNVKEGVEYPATMLNTAENDSRVDAMHARKMGAMLQYVNKNNPVYIYTETEAGHGSGRPLRKIIELRALVLSFYTKTLGLSSKN